jgi:hypothetical protein
MWNWVSHTKERTQVEGVQEQSVKRMSGAMRESNIRKLHNVDFHNLYSLQNSITVQMEGS